MQIIRSKNYLKKLQNIMEFIAQDSVNRAIEFQIDLDENIDNLAYMSYKFRKSNYFDDENIRDLIFKGYVIPYEIDQKNNTIIIIGIKKYQESF